MKQTKRLIGLILYATGTLSLLSQTFSGSNNPGNGTDFSVPVGAATTNLSLSVSGSSAAWSYLLVKQGTAPTSDTDYDFSARLDRTSNALHFESPEIAPGQTLFVRVKTPAASAAHNFSLVVEANRNDLRSAARPVTKKVVALASGLEKPGTNHYYRVEITAASNWRISVSASNSLAPDLYLQRGATPTTTSYYRKVIGATNNLLALSATEAVPGVYYIGVLGTSVPAAGTRYTLKCDTFTVTTLAWDPGLTHDGEGVSQSSPSEQDYYFRIVTGSPSVGAWRTALKVLTNDANLYLGRGFLPTPTTNSFKVERKGSVGTVLALGTQFQPGEEWYILVSAKEKTDWRLVSGTPFVQELGSLADGEGSGSGSVEIGPEGIRFFKTEVPSEALAWRLWLHGLNNTIMLRKASVPLTTLFESAQSGQMLVVPPYLTASSYFIGVAGLPETMINLDSRQQPVAELAYNGATNATLSGYGYSSYRVTVPANQIAWQIYLPSTNGNPNVAVRRNSVPNENNNDAMSELTTTNADNITLVPPTLSDGTFYITVYTTNLTALSNSPPLQYTLQDGTPAITDIPYRTQVTNDDPNRSGWRFYRVSDVDEQKNSLGWNLYLTNNSPGTRIALRRANVPSTWAARIPNPIQVNNYDVLSSGNYLQRPDHQPDVWYIGIYNPTNVLGAFTLVTGDLVPTPLSDGIVFNQTNNLPGRWEFFNVSLATEDITGPDAIVGWDLRLTNVNGGQPKIVVRKDKLPISLTGNVTSAGGTWPSGGQWVAGQDWTKRSMNTNGTINEDGRIVALGMDRPLTPGNYFIAVQNTGTNSGDYGILSRWIGHNRTIPVTDLAYNGGTSTNSLPPREAAYYRVIVPEGSRSWKTHLQVTNGEAMLVVVTNSAPSIDSEKRMQKPGDEYYLRLPAAGQSTLPETVCYLTVIGEGAGATPTRIGGGNSGYVIRSVGALQEIDLGPLDQEDLWFTNSLAAGDTVAVHFEPVRETWGFWSLFEQTSGNPWQVLRSGTSLPDPGVTTGGSRDNYGNEGGEVSAVSSPAMITSAGASDTETIIFKARNNTATDWPDAQFVLRIKPTMVSAMQFDGGVFSITNGEPVFGNFFVVDVPAEALGWDVRITNVTSGNPSLYVSKDVVSLGPWAWGPQDPYGMSQWPEGGWLDAYKDWTQRPLSADGTVLENQWVQMVSRGRPMLMPDRYFIQVVNEQDNTPVNCTVVSRGVGPKMSLPIQPLEFTNGVAQVEKILPREVSYFKVAVPTNATSWKMRLENTQGETLLAVLTDRPPNVGTTEDSNSQTGAGKAMHRTGQENYLLLPDAGKDTLKGGTYYISVVSEGMTTTDVARIGTNSSSFQLTSIGEAPRRDLGAVGPGITANADTNSLIAGDTQVYQFTVAPGTTVVEARLETLSGTPAMSARAGTRIPNPTPAVGKLPIDIYGNEGGETGNITTNTLSWANPTAGTYTLIVKARGTNNTSYVVKVSSHSVATTLLGFDSGDSAADNSQEISQGAMSWAYYIVNVPTNAAGWDIRAANVTSGTPKLVVRRGSMPTTTTTTPWSAPGTATAWPTNSQWGASADWTKRSLNAGGANEEGRILAMGMGRPLEPGIYYVGITNASTNVANYTILSRGIGTGYSIPLLDLPINGNLTNLALAAREAAYYRVVIPSNAPGWKVSVSMITNIGGECMLTALKGKLPNAGTAGGTLANGKTMQKPGNEHFVVLPTANQAGLAASTNYLAVIGEGKNPSSSTAVGTGETGYVISSAPELVLRNLGIVTADDIVQEDHLESGDVAAYRFTVFPGTHGVKVKLEGRSGNPVAVILPGDRLPDPGAAVTGAALEAYGNEGGTAPSDGNGTILTLANPTPGNYTLLVKARALGTSSATYPDADYTLRIGQILANNLNFTGTQNTNGWNNTFSGLVENDERMFYRVIIPATNNGLPVIGWKLTLTQSSGLATMRVSHNLLPSDDNSPQMGWATAQAVIAPPYLTNGTWFVELRGSNSTAFTLTSEALALERAEWTMPGPGEGNANPGVSEPYFADTAVGTNGEVLADSVFLEQGTLHYYGVRVPENNLGVLRTEVRASGGNPDLYLRAGAVPTLQHGTNGGSGTIWDRAMTSAQNTEYANWVPLNGKTETRLKPGLWYLAVKAASNSNARYRMLFTTGAITDLPINGAALTNQIVVGGDWLYYRFTAPSALPVGLGLVFGRDYGDAMVQLRDEVPPGNGLTSVTGEIKDWKTDAKNGNGPYFSFTTQGAYNLNAPPLRPGQVYYLGLHGASLSTCSIRITNYASNAKAPETLDFYGGIGTANLPAYSKTTFKIVVPTEAARWKHTSVHTTNVSVYLEQGTVPPTTISWKGSSANSSLNQSLLTWSTALKQYLPGTWPWVPGQDYYLMATNTSGHDETFSVIVDGRNEATDDNDNNGLPDGWELRYFGRTGQVASADPDKDGVNNLDEYHDGSDPTDAISYNVRLYLLNVNGVIQTSPSLTCYPQGSEVVLTALPDPGYAFMNWVGDLTGTENPATLLMNGHKTVAATFQVSNDLPPTMGQCTLSANGEVSVTVKGAPNQAVSMEYSRDLIEWTPAGTITLGPDGEGTFQHTPASASAGFYRGRL